MGDILMSGKERKRLEMMSRVRDGQMTLVKASELLGLSYRQAKRCWARYQAQGDSGLVHQLRGKVSSRRIPARTRLRILTRYRERYGDFGPTLAAEHLVAEGLQINHETLRRWLLAEGLWVKRRQRQKHRQWRERKACFGEMVQMDGSHHDWFEGRRERAVLMVMVDDATHRTYARFFEEETTLAAYETFERYGRKQGLPQSLYVDRDSIYQTERDPTLEEQLAGERPMTQFGRAMKELGVKVILAYSPQAKGRVERCNGTLQDRLVKALRLEKISDLESANAFLEGKFLPEFNRRFMRPARAEANLHQKVALERLRQTLSWETKRVVQMDWTVRWQNQWFQLTKDNAELNLAGKSIVVRRRRDGRIELEHQGRALKHKVLDGKPVPLPPKPRLGRAPRPPKSEHPWRRFGFATGRPFWSEVQAEAEARSQHLR